MPWCTVGLGGGSACPLLPNTETSCTELSGEKAGIYWEVSFGITEPQLSLVESCHITERAAESGCWKLVLCVSHINISLVFVTKALSGHLETEPSQMTWFTNILLVHPLSLFPDILFLFEKYLEPGYDISLTRVSSGLSLTTHHTREKLD